MLVEILRDYHGMRVGQRLDVGGIGEILCKRGFAKEVKPKANPPKAANKRRAKRGSRTTTQ